jgi:Bacterial SH3 domain
MKKLSVVALLITLGIVSGGFKLKDEPVVGEGCRVSDPTGTPLNVRSAPKGGSIRGALSNDTVVKVLEVRGDWARIRPHDAPGKSGWVYSKYLDCSD